MKKVAIVGTQGVPAKYGGFETLVENIIGENCGIYGVLLGQGLRDKERDLQRGDTEIYPVSTCQWGTKHSLRYLVAVALYHGV